MQRNTSVLNNKSYLYRSPLTVALAIILVLSYITCNAGDAKESEMNGVFTWSGEEQTLVTQTAKDATSLEPDSKSALIARMPVNVSLETTPYERPSSSHRIHIDSSDNGNVPSKPSAEDTRDAITRKPRKPQQTLGNNTLLIPCERVTKTTNGPNLPGSSGVNDSATDAIVDSRNRRNAKNSGSKTHRLKRPHHFGAWHKMITGWNMNVRDDNLRASKARRSKCLADGKKMSVFMQMGSSKPRVVSQRPTFNGFDDTINIINNKRSYFKSSDYREMSATASAPSVDKAMRQSPQNVEETISEDAYANQIERASAKPKWPGVESRPNRRYRRTAAGAEFWSGNSNYILNANGNSYAENKENSSGDKSSTQSISDDSFSNTSTGKSKVNYYNNSGMRQMFNESSTSKRDSNRRNSFHATSVSNLTADNSGLFYSKMLVSQGPRAAVSITAEAATAMSRPRPIIISSNLLSPLPAPPATTTPPPPYASKPYSSLSENFFKDIEEMESKLSTDKRQQLVLTRRKRYLVFPEGSSFQLVFDLIIPIVDYTNFAIMGITCAVAWELPSKPPSELVENLRDKLNDGTLGLQRRNDSIDSLKYVNTKAKDTNAKDTNPTSMNTDFAMSGDDFEKHASNKSPHRTNQIKTVSDDRSFNRLALYQKNFDRFPNQILPPSYSQTTKPNIHPHFGAKNYLNLRPSNSYTQSNYNYYTDNRDEYAGDKSNIGRWRADSSYWPQLHDRDNGGIQRHNWQESAWQQADNHYNYKGVSYQANDNLSKAAASIAAGNANRPHTAPFTPAAVDSNARQEQTDAGAPTYSTNTDWHRDHWWQRNKGRIQQKWAKYKQKKWSKAAEKTPGNIESGRTLLTATPKHRIFPIFGKRRRRRGKRDLSSFEKAIDSLMEQSHYREHLQSRQRLYGKIEQMLKARGHNGTACVLRALCETGQRRNRGHYHYHHHYQQKRQHLRSQQKLEEPQSFIAELLRAIFTLPKDILPLRASSAVVSKTRGALKRENAEEATGSRATIRSDTHASNDSTFNSNHSGNRKEHLNYYYHEDEHRTNAGSNELPLDNAADATAHEVKADGSRKRPHNVVDYKLETQPIKASVRRDTMAYHLDWSYREAHEAFGFDCAELFSTCELSIWNSQI